MGREIELAAFEQKLAASGLAVITGMPGAGKKTLASVLVQRACDPDKTFWHKFHQDEGIEQVIWRLAGFLYWHDQRDVWTMLQRARLSGGQLPPTRDLLDYVAQTIQDQGYTLCLADLQFLSSDDVDLLDDFIQRLLGAETFFVIASQVVPKFVRLAEVQALAGLSLEDVRCFLAERDLPLSEELLAKLYDQTGGNAQFLTLAIDALRTARDPARMIDQLSETDDIERYLMNQVDEGLGEQERGVMGGVSALLGHPGTRDAIEEVLDADRLRRILSDLSYRNLLSAGQSEWGKEYGQNAVL